MHPCADKARRVVCRRCPTARTRFVRLFTPASPKGVCLGRLHAPARGASALYFFRPVTALACRVRARPPLHRQSSATHLPLRAQSSLVQPTLPASTCVPLELAVSPDHESTDSHRLSVQDSRVRRDAHVLAQPETDSHCTFVCVLLCAGFHPSSPVFCLYFPLVFMEIHLGRA